LSLVYTPAYKPRAKQEEALKKLWSKEAFGLLMSMRTGKSKVILDDFGQLELLDKVDDLCIIGPAGALPPWLSEIDRHASYDLKQRVRAHLWRSGGGVHHNRALTALMEHPGPRVLLMNIEALSSVKRARETLLEFLRQRRTMVAIDEATVIKSPSAARTKFVLQAVAPLADYRRILSGLLTPKSPLDAYAPFAFLDWRIIGQRSYYAFRNRYATMRTEFYGGRSIQIVDGYRNIEELQSRIAPYSYRCTLEDCYDVPEKIYMLREVELTPEQKRIYDDLKAFATAQLDATSHVTATVVIAQIVRLHQVLCGHTMDEQGHYHEIPENRTAALIELLSETDEKACIWVSYDADIHRVARALRKEFGENSVARFWGGNRNVREEEEARWKSDPGCRFMVATPAAGGRGREWSAANLVIYYSNGYNLEWRSQSEDRPQAVGKSQHVTYIDLIVPKTVDEKILRSLRQKINLATAITGENWRKWVLD
jgi:SNF2 family DNA or RNA helicase